MCLEGTVHTTGLAGGFDSEIAEQLSFRLKLPGRSFLMLWG